MRFSEYMSVTPIDKGWSGDRKYKVTEYTGASYLLRIAPEEKYKAKEAEFELMRQVSALGVPTCRPLDLGLCDEGVYMLLEWIDGMDAEHYIAALTEEEAYRLGIYAGDYLRRIHTLPAPKDAESWSERYGRKIDRKQRMYAECELKYENGQLLVDFINANRHLIDSRPQVMHHGDYHTGNMMVNRNSELIIIDFDRHDFGDPWEEFNRIIWCIQCSPTFASGMVDGYFGGNVPEEFWRLLALYMANNTLSSLPWAIPYGQGEIDIMRGQAKQLLEWHDGLTRIVPTWYKRA